MGTPSVSASSGQPNGQGSPGFCLSTVPDPGTETTASQVPARSVNLVSAPLPSVRYRGFLCGIASRGCSRSRPNRWRIPSWQGVSLPRSCPVQLCLPRPSALPQRRVSTPAKKKVSLRCQSQMLPWRAHGRPGSPVSLGHGRARCRTWVHCPQDRNLHDPSRPTGTVSWRRFSMPLCPVSDWVASPDSSDYIRRDILPVPSRSHA